MPVMLSDLNIKRAGNLQKWDTRSRGKSSVIVYIKGASIFKEEMEETSDKPTKSIQVSRRLQTLELSDSVHGGNRGGTLSSLELKEDILNDPPECDSPTDSEWPWG